MVWEARWSGKLGGQGTRWSGKLWEARWSGKLGGQGS